jgi:hypothetical protein
VKSNGILADGSEAAAFHPALAPLEGEACFRKPRVSAFSADDFGEWLETKGIDTWFLAVFQPAVSWSPLFARPPTWTIESMASPTAAETATRSCMKY